MREVLDQALMLLNSYWQALFGIRIIVVYDATRQSYFHWSGSASCHLVGIQLVSETCPETHSTRELETGCHREMARNQSALPQRTRLAANWHDCQLNSNAAKEDRLTLRELTSRTLSNS